MRDLLTIGMATYGEFDSVWFTLTGLTANHPKVRYLVVDNTPEKDLRTEAITRACGGTYYHRPDLVGTSKPRDAVFRFAETPWVMCIDSHIILETGAVEAALDWIGKNGTSSDLVQGPLVWDSGEGYSTHWTPHPKGLWGTWGVDSRGEGTEPFEIPQMGLGLWLMRKEAWVGFNPLFRGFGGEEGYTHEKVRQRGNRCLCLPRLRWRHKFRDTAGWNKNPPPPYPLRLEDHTFNLLVGHRELAVEAEGAIYDDFGKRLPAATWTALKKEAEEKQPVGAEVKPQRQRLLALWYSDNTAPTLQKSAETVVAAAAQCRNHSVTVSAVTWEPFAGNPFAEKTLVGSGNAVRWGLFSGAKQRSHLTILKQIEQAVAAAGSDFDAVVFCEHDVLYPEDYFDRIGDALNRNPDAPVVSNLEYIGLNGTGWQAVKERHEPLHQLTVRWSHFQENLKRCERDCQSQGWCLLEPEGDRSGWVRLPAENPHQMPSVHINHTKGRFTGHGDVCYHPIGYSLWHPHWGEAKNWYPESMENAEVEPNAFKGQESKGCSCAADKAATVEEWAAKAANDPSDFHLHVNTLRDLASKCRSATELSLWLKPADAAIAAGLPKDGTFLSICSGQKPQWNNLKKWLGKRFQSRIEQPAEAEIEPTDLLFIDTEHTADALHPLLLKHHTKVAKYLVVHCTETFGEQGDDPNRPGVLHSLRTFCQQHPEWVVKYRSEEGHGLLVLSKCEEDVKEKPSLWKQGINYAKAMAKHNLNGRKLVSLEVMEERLSQCALCPERALDACSACGCPLLSKAAIASEECGLVKIGKEPKWKAETDPARLKQAN